ncbi:MAG: GNAT family N-acetyltransferase [Actinomycetota bacterium]|nr:GNAT family N-acetyltransferase [Actinomycetota bacterium]
MIRRARTLEDFAFCADVCSEVHPDNPVTGEVFAARATGAFLVDDRGGYALVDRSSIPGTAFGMVRVRPDARRRGLGSSLFDAAAGEARALELGRMYGRVDGADAESLAFAERRGFRETARDVTVVLEVGPGDGEVADGIVELEDQHLRGAYEVAAECLPEMALPQVAAASPYEEWVERESDSSPVAFVALDGNAVVGYARLCELSDRRLENGLTAVRRSHRRRGLALALKRAQIAWAAEHGYTEIVTSTVAGNDAMRGVNERLGYRPVSEEIVVEGPVP